MSFDNRALCPINDPADLARYAAVDGCETEFERFTNDLDQLTAEQGRSPTVLVLGHDGTGKTSFLHRCAHELDRRHSTVAQTDATVVDLSEEKLSPLDAETRMQLIYERVIDECEFQGLLPTDIATRLRTDMTPQRGIPILARTIDRVDGYVILHTPPAQTAEEVALLASLSHRSIAILVECSEPAACERLRTTPLHEYTTFMRYELDILGQDDGWTFVSKASADPQHLPIDKTVIDQFMTERIKGRGRTTVRELVKTYRAVIILARSEGAIEVTWDHFSRYYLQNAEVP